MLGRTTEETPIPPLFPPRGLQTPAAPPSPPPPSQRGLSNSQPPPNPRPTPPAPARPQQHRTGPPREVTPSGAARRGGTRPPSGFPPLPDPHFYFTAAAPRAETHPAGERAAAGREAPRPPVRLRPILPPPPRLTLKMA